MEPEIHPPQPKAPIVGIVASAQVNESSAPSLGEQIFNWMSWTFVGPHGLRAGWLVGIFVLLLGLIGTVVGFVFIHFHIVDLSQMDHLTASLAAREKLMEVLGLVGAMSAMALIERRRSLLAYNLIGPSSIPHFLSGIVAGFLALSALVAAMAWGGWLHIGSVALSGAEIWKYGAMWAVAFLLVGCMEEGMFRGYLQFTLTRGLNFWWALGINALLCASLYARALGISAWGVYAMASLGLFPCLILQLKKIQGAGFWQAAWVTSTIFGYIHLGNNGENWIGIFGAALIGFVFCVSVRLTGTAWWAIGCHAAWDWAETYFYGTANSGIPPQGHYLTTSTSGNVIWSGGTDGPEGSLLVIGIILLLLTALVVIYGRKRAVAAPFGSGDRIA
jgi:membrane protease YdiL (CAAX protease family)